MEISAQIMQSVSTFSAHTLQPFLTAQEDELAALAAESEAAAEEFQQSAAAGGAELARLTELHASQKADAAAETARLSELEASVGALELRAGSLLPAQVATLGKQVAAGQSAQAKLARDVDALTAMHVRELDAVSRGVGLFRRNLGVDFRVQDGKLLVAFAYITRPAAGAEAEAEGAAASPVYTHTVSLFVDENKEYQVSCCTPPLAEMGALLESLNQSNNFAGFIAQVRRAFVAAEKQKEQQQQQ